MKMTAEYTCIRDEQLQGQSRKIEALETRADYKEEMIKELKEDMKEIKQDMKDLKQDINNLLLQSVNSDGDLKDIIRDQDNRITALETAKKEQWKLFVGTGTVITIIIFFIDYILKI